MFTCNRDINKRTWLNPHLLVVLPAKLYHLILEAFGTISIRILEVEIRVSRLYLHNQNIGIKNCNFSKFLCILKPIEQLQTQILNHGWRTSSPRSENPRCVHLQSGKCAPIDGSAKCPEAPGTAGSLASERGVALRPEDLRYPLGSFPEGVVPWIRPRSGRIPSHYWH